MSILAKSLSHFKIGTIVTLKSNHLKSIDQFPELLLAGEPTFVTPLMIVTEVLVVKTDKIDEETGKLKNLKGNFQYKCIWFSNKSFKIEENWFYEKELLSIAPKSEVDEKLQFGDNIVLKTNSLELQKKKTYIENDKNKVNTKISHLLNFCSPVFIFLSYASVEKKEPFIDSHTGRLKRIYSSKLAKVKSFNVKEDKYSEFLIPVEAIQKIGEINDDILKQYIDAKSSKKLLVHHNISESESITKIFSVNSISSVSNIYIAEIKNVFSEEIERIEITNERIKSTIDLKNNEIYPAFSQNKGVFSVKSIEDFLKSTIVDNQYRVNSDINEEYINELHTQKLLKIVYKNKREKITTRFCIPIHVFSIVVMKYSPKDKKEIPVNEYYMQSFCLLRSDYRNFKIERIMFLEVVENEYLNDFAFENWKKELI